MACRGQAQGSWAQRCRSCRPSSLALRRGLQGRHADLRLEAAGLADLVPVPKRPALTRTLQAARVVGSQAGADCRIGMASHGRKPPRMSLTEGRVPGAVHGTESVAAAIESGGLLWLHQAGHASLTLRAMPWRSAGGRHRRRPPCLPRQEQKAVHPVRRAGAPSRQPNRKRRRFENGTKRQTRCASRRQSPLPRIECSIDAALEIPRQVADIQ
ncbi:MAG: hypothetical protein KatS3mg004_0391 [Bryobacteraceae bacterium]|nr:MAG: hypothetical protein KatS3mg004_0391 [Bryobacteraceae bacterium]